MCQQRKQRKHRITPAYAGKTRVVRKGGGSIKDHPRLRGENDSMKKKWIAVLGSPPPTRGKHSVTGYITPAQRITPAYAGKTGRADEGQLHKEDHPRLRGENFFSMFK